MVLIVDKNENTYISYLSGRSCGRELMDALSVITKTYTFLRALVWTRPQFILPWLLAKTSKLNFKHEIHATAPEARFSKVPIINGPVKLLLFTWKIVLHLTWLNYQLMKQNGVFSQDPRSYSFFFSIWIFDFGPEKLSELWRNVPLKISKNFE